MKVTPSQLEQIAARAMTLYSRPTVAMQIVKLTEQPGVDARQLKECLEKDPALTCKILRVVNSSLFGLSRPVADLNQAVALLGIKPLKLLVLGFSLPDNLFAEVAAKQLQWYWTNTLTRAVAARLLSEQLWQQSGDEAFIAGLLQDIGILVLVRELGKPYVRFLTGVMDEDCHLTALERATIGFDHVQLSAALLTRWQLPPRLVEAIAMPKYTATLATLTPPEADLPQVLHLAELLVRLVGQRQLRVLPELLEAGAKYRTLTKSKLTELVRQLQPQVDQLADALSLELRDGRDFNQVLLDAHEQMSILSEEFAAARPAEDSNYDRVLEQSRELSAAMQRFLGGEAVTDQAAGHGQQHSAYNAPNAHRAATANHAHEPNNTSMLVHKLSAAGNRCRQRRQELSLVLFEPHINDNHTDVGAELAGTQVRRALGRACAQLDQQNVTLVSLSASRTAAILCDCERHTAVIVAQSAISQLAASDALPGAPAATALTTLCAGVATVSGVPKNFDPLKLMECAERCLHAAHGGGLSSVKSIEV